MLPDKWVKACIDHQWRLNLDFSGVLLIVMAVQNTYMLAFDGDLQGLLVAAVG